MQLGAQEETTPRSRRPQSWSSGAMQPAIGLGSDAERSKTRNPALDPPTDGCRGMRLKSGATKRPTRTKLWRKA
eukprot:7063837-Alexandrium_andersonii.AAC.1